VDAVVRQADGQAGRGKDAADKEWNDEPDTGLSFADLQQRFLWLLRAAYRSRWIILALLAAALSLGIIATLLTTPLYTATASAQIDQQAERVLGTEDEQPAAAFQDADRFLQTNIEVLQSRATAVRVAQSLGLLSDDVFIEQMNGNVAPDATDQVRRERVVALLLENLAVELPRDSRIARISFRSPNPALSAKVANAFVDNFITGNLQRKFNSTSYARTFLEQQLVPARERLEQSERLVIAYARQAGLIDTQGSEEGTANGAGPNSTTLSSLVGLNNAYANATANRIAAEERLRVAANTPVGALPESYSNSGVQRLYETRAAKAAELQNLSKRYEQDYPTVLQIRAEVEELTRQISAINDDIRRSLSDQYETAREQEQALAAEVERMKEAALAERGRSVEYNTLRRDADSNRAMYEALLQRFQEVSAASGISASNVSVVDRAEPPLNPTSPNLRLNTAIALLLGLFVSLAVVILRELYDDRVQNTSDVERKFGLAALGVIPQFHGDVAIEKELGSPNSVISEAYRSVATAVLLSSARRAPKILALTSAQPGEGKSSSAVGLASAFEGLNKRTLLLECDLRRPSLKNAIDGTDREAGLPGLCEYLARQSDAPVIYHHPKLRFDYILAGAVPPDPVELLGSPLLSSLLEELVESYDHIILDAPPILGLADVPIIASHSEALIFVVEANRSHRGRAKAAIRRVSRFEAPVVGAILTNAPVSSRFGYGYGEEYYSYS